tara:strand:- start:269 stop:529 length:261 start_codon:yes stop_codon:yes gene_type:complete
MTILKTVSAEKLLSIIDSKLTDADLLRRFSTTLDRVDLCLDRVEASLDVEGEPVVGSDLLIILMVQEEQQMIRYEREIKRRELEVM